MRAVSRKLTLAMVLACVITASALGADEVRVVGNQCRAMYDGTFVMYYLVSDSATGIVREVKESDFKRIYPAAWQKLVVTQNIRWEGVSQVNWAMSPDAKPFKKKYNKIFKKLINKGRGTPLLPEFKLTGKVVQITQIDPRSVEDNTNTIYMTSDDRFFSGKSGVAAYMNTWFGSGGSVGLQDGRFTSAHKITEADGFFRSDHFSVMPDPARGISASFNSDLVVVHEFGHAFGFQHTPYTNDYMSYRRQHIDAKALKNKNSDMWKLNNEKDKLYYDDNYASAPRMMPLDGTVLDLTYLHAPGTSDDSLNMNSYHPIVITTLKGFSGKQMSLSVYKGTATAASPPAKALFTIQGDSIDFFIRMESGYPVVGKYRLSLLNLGQEKYWKKISKLVDKKGKAKQINGVSFAKAYECTIVVSGYMNEDSTQKQTVSAVVWFVKN